MTLSSHGDEKYRSSALLGAASGGNSLRIEHRQIGSGSHNAIRPDCTELVYILAGQAPVRRRADGLLQEGLALPGTSWLLPVGTDEKLLELEGSTECLIIYLPARLPADSTMISHGIDPGQSGCPYEGGFADPTLAQIALALHGFLDKPRQPTDRLFVEALRSALSAHLVGHYSIDRRRHHAPTQPIMEPRRLQRVFDYVEARLGERISLDDLAGQACLSPFHFSRQFRKATGRSPHRYLMECRIAAAKDMISKGTASLVEVALDTGFGSQANFSRTFRKMTGLSPREYRLLHHNHAPVATSARANSAPSTACSDNTPPQPAR